MEEINGTRLPGVRLINYTIALPQLCAEDNATQRLHFNDNDFRKLCRRNGERESHLFFPISRTCTADCLRNIEVATKRRFPIAWCPWCAKPLLATKQKVSESRYFLPSTAAVFNIVWI